MAGIEDLVTLYRGEPMLGESRYLKALNQGLNAPGSGLGLTKKDLSKLAGQYYTKSPNVAASYAGPFGKIKSMTLPSDYLDKFSKFQTSVVNLPSGKFKQAGAGGGSNYLVPKSTIKSFNPSVNYGQTLKNIASSINPFKGLVDEAKIIKAAYELSGPGAALKDTAKLAGSTVLKSLSTLGSLPVSAGILSLTPTTLNEDEEDMTYEDYRDLAIREKVLQNVTGTPIVRSSPDIYEYVEKEIFGDEKTKDQPTPPTTGGGGSPAQMAKTAAETRKKDLQQMRGPIGRDDGPSTPTRSQNVARTASRVGPGGRVRAYGLKEGGRVGYALGSPEPLNVSNEEKRIAFDIYQALKDIEEQYTGETIAGDPSPQNLDPSDRRQGTLMAGGDFPEFETYADVIDAYNSGVAVEPGESLTDYIKRNNIKIKEIEMDPLGDLKKVELVDELEPGPLKDELLKDFDPSQETYEEYLQRKNLDRPFNAQDGGRARFNKGSPFAVGEIRKAALANLDDILKDYYSGMGTRALTKKYFPNSADAKKGTSSSVLENVIKENADAKKVAKRPSPIGTTAKGVSPAKVILNNPKAKAEFIKFANAKGNTVLMSMEEAGKIAKKYLPEGTKVAGYSSRTGFMDSGLRDLITKKVQLGSNPEGEVNTAESERKAKKKRDTRIKTTAPFKASGTPNFAFHHIMPIGGEVSLTTNDIAIINKRMNSVLSGYNKQLNSIADGITNAYNKQPPDLKRIDQLNKAGESIVKKAVKELPKEYRNLIGFNKLQPVFDEYGTVINLSPEKVGGANQKKPGIKLEELTKNQATSLRKQIKTDALSFEKAGLKDKILSGTGKILKGVGKVIKPIGYAVGTKALFDARALADEQGIKLSKTDQLMALDSGDPNVAINNYMRRNNPEFAAAERAKDLAKMSDDFTEVGNQVFTEPKKEGIMKVADSVDLEDLTDNKDGLAGLMA